MMINKKILEDIFPDFTVEHCNDVPEKVSIFEIRHLDYPGRFVKLYVGCEKSYNLTKRTTHFLKDVSGVLCINSDELGLLTTCDGIRELSYIPTSKLSENGYVNFNSFLMNSDDVESIWYSQLS